MNAYLEELFTAMNLLIEAKKSGHRVENELNKVITAVMKELGLEK